MIRRTLLRVLAFVALVVAGATFAFAAPAQATPKPIGISVDGVTFTDGLSSSLFAGATVVPGTVTTRSFWVENRTLETGHLAVAVKGVTGTDPSLIGALSIRAVAGTTVGPVVAFTSINPCRTLVSGISLPAGATVQVDVSLALGTSLASQIAQGSVGAFRIPLTLTSMDVPAPDGCGVTGTVTPPTGGPTGNSPPASPPGTIGTAEISGSADGNVLPTLADGPLSGLGGTGAVRNLAVIPNTGRFWQEYDIVGYLVALVVGGIFAWWWRRRRTYEEEAYA